MEGTAFSTVVTSTADLPLVVERTMFWDSSHYGGSGATAVSSPSTDWRFAEGVENSFFQTFVMLENPNETPATATVVFLLEGAPQNSPPVSTTLTLPPRSRTTLDTGTVAGAVNHNFGLDVTADQPIVAERATYFGTTPTRLWEGGDGSPGSTARQTTWFFSEGNTSGLFDTFFVVANTGGFYENVLFTFLLDTGQTVTRTHQLAPYSRYTMPVDSDYQLGTAIFSTTITGTSSDIVAEREMYWTSRVEPPPVLNGVTAANPWVDSHSVFGVAGPGTRWGFAEGRVGGALDFHSYLELGNPSSSAADLTVTYLRTDGTTIVKTYTIAPTSRFTIDVGATSGLQNESFGTVVESTNGVPIIAERAMYWTVGGVLFAGGIDTMGTRLP
jgi:hypothetical protein